VNDWEREAINRFLELLEFEVDSLTAALIVRDEYGIDLARLHDAMVTADIRWYNKGA
jgi:hypothetical protein